METIYPVTICRSRYGGSYEGAKWFAINTDDESSFFEDLRGGDVECSNIFHLIGKEELINPFGEKVFCGRGDTPNEAYSDLEKRIGANKAREEKKN